MPRRLDGTSMPSERPSLAEDMVSAARYFAAIDAVQAGCGRTKEEPSARRVDPRPACESRHWNGSGQPGLADRSGQVRHAGGPPRRQQILKFWQRDADLACVHDKTELSKLPADERAAWGLLGSGGCLLLAKLTVQANSPSR